MEQRVLARHRKDFKLALNGSVLGRIARAIVKDGSLIDYESQKINKPVLSTTVAELYSFMKCFGSCQFLLGLWMGLSGEVANIHTRTDAKNLGRNSKNNSLT